MTERRGRGAAPSSLAIDNLRAVVILLVLAFHSVLAYLSSLPAKPFAFDSPPFLWRSFPIVDSQRWLGFDLFCAWLDVSLMSFFFLLSGLFAWPSLSRKGTRAFLIDRARRLGVPFLVVVLLLMPLAHYPAYLQTATEPGIAAFWRHWLALPLWPTGPMWFLWLLLLWDGMAAGLYRLMAGQRDAVVRLSLYAREHPAKFLAGFVLVGLVAYIPLAVVFGPWGWVQRGPFSLQLSRPLHYALYFFAGVAIGACGIERGLIAADGKLVRCWAWWLGAAAVLFAAWLGLTAPTMDHPATVSLGLKALAASSFALACFTSCFFALVVAVRFARARGKLLDSLNANAYGMYLVHYAAVVWLQYALLGMPWPAVLKAAIVFAGTVLASWSASAALCRVRRIAEILGAAHPASAARIPSAAGLAD
jgi:peptidoglycan/LPS O-acetylase OafA/YrhL